MEKYPADCGHWESLAREDSRTAGRRSTEYGSTAPYLVMHIKNRWILSRLSTCRNCLAQGNFSCRESSPRPGVLRGVREG